MRRNWGLAILTLFVALLFVSGCAKKTALRGETIPKEAAEVKPAAKAPKKDAMKDDEARRRAEEERAAKEAAAKKAEKAQATKEAAAAKELYEFTDIYFDFDKFSLRDEARAILNQHSARLNKNKDARLTIEGHCDERGTAEYNLALGERRANAAAKYLSDMGIDGKRISTISYGFERPLDPGHNEAAWAKNRRAHFNVSGSAKK